MATVAERIQAKCQEISDLLVVKNRAYGNSALEPVRIFGQGDAEALIRVRLDDKLSRIRNNAQNPDALGEDPVLDLVGYLVLLMLAREDKAAQARQ
jgi:hypothetical protein